MVDFILNNRQIIADLPVGTMLLDFLRSKQNTKSIKAGCKTGSCGSCLVLAGKPDGEVVSYLPVNSCILPLEEVHGKHIVTLEGLNKKRIPDLNPIQQFLTDQGGIQCGYCTPGIVISLTGFLLNSPAIDKSRAAIALDGNLCRCTGYQGIRRAVDLLCQKFTLPDKTGRIKWLVEKDILPAYFSDIPKRLNKIGTSSRRPSTKTKSSGLVVAGGTITWQNSEELSPDRVLFCRKEKICRGYELKRTNVLSEQ